jgi:hypothetical protein
MDKFEQLERLARLREQGALTDEEFYSEKAKLLGAESPSLSSPEPPTPAPSSPEPHTSNASSPAPQATSGSEPGGYWTASRVLLAVIAVPAVFLLCLNLGGNMREEGVGFIGQLIPKIIDTDGNSGCSRFGDFCYTVTCSVKNTGTAAGDVTVTMELIGEQGKIQHQHSEYIFLRINDAKSVSHDFTEARMFGGTQQYRCRAKAH